MMSAEPRSERGVGDAAPPFGLPDETGVARSLTDSPGMTVLFFFPKADTPGCTTEARDFSSRAADFAAVSTTVIGISADPPRKLARFKSRYALGITLLSDESQEVLRAYGVWGEKSMYGRTFQGIFRTTFLIERDGRIAAVWRNVKVPGHADIVLAAARERGRCMAFSEN